MNILTQLRNWRYRRLYTRLVFAYLKHKETSTSACHYAGDAFKAITGHYYPDCLYE